MNVIVSNKNQDVLSNLDIDLIKSINGEFTPEEIAAQFPPNFYYNKMVLDITAIKNTSNGCFFNFLVKNIIISAPVAYIFIHGR